MKIKHYNTVTSTFDVIKELAFAESINAWDSVQAYEQTEGKGQLRSKWVSLKGNLFVSWLLPSQSPFTGSASAIACGTLCIEALRKMGYNLFLKWPNDLVFIQGASIFKIGGLLIEEKLSHIFAGLGLNLFFAPADKDLDDSTALSPASLNDFYNEILEADNFWQKMLSIMIDIWKNSNFSKDWLQLANKILAFRNENIAIIDGKHRHYGILKGVLNSGACILIEDDQEKFFTHGTMRKI